MMGDRSKWQIPKSRDYRQYETLDELLLSYIEKGRVRTKTEARKLAYRDIPQESYYQGKILTMLKEEFPDGRFRKNAAGIGQDGGEPDIIGVLDGRYIAIECKRPLLGEATALQVKAVEEILQAGGLAMFAVYPDEVRDKILKWMFVRGGFQD